MRAFKKMSYTLLTVWALSTTACHDSAPIDESKLDLDQTQDGDDLSMTGGKLTRIAAHAIGDLDTEEELDSIAENVQHFVGRYVVHLNCEDAFATCEQGNADFMVTLLGDGTARHSIIRTGVVSSHQRAQYREDHWAYDESNQQIVVYHDNGVEFFYNVDTENNLTMDVEKIKTATEINRQYFSEGHPLPRRDYLLKRVS
jgi:hypothetical protein